MSNVFFKKFFFHLLSCLFCVNLLVQSSRFFVRTVFQRIRIFLTSNFRFAVSFLCTTIETIFKIVLSPNGILKELFFLIFKLLFFMFFCVSQLMRFLEIFYLKTVFQRKKSNFLTFNYPFLIFFLCTTIETVTSVISCQTFFL